MGCGGSVGHAYIEQGGDSAGSRPSSLSSTISSLATALHTSTTGGDTTDTGHSSDSGGSATSRGTLSTTHRCLTGRTPVPAPASAAAAAAVAAADGPRPRWRVFRKAAAAAVTSQEADEGRRQKDNGQESVSVITSWREYMAEEEEEEVEDDEVRGHRSEAPEVESQTSSSSSSSKWRSAVSEDGASDSKLVTGTTINIQFPDKDDYKLIGGGSGSPRMVSHLVATDKTVYPRDFFWWPYKRLLLGDHQRVSEIDQHVLNVKQDLDGDLHGFLAELNSICETEAETVRAVFQWVATNIAYKHSPSGATSTRHSDSGATWERDVEHSSTIYIADSNGTDGSEAPSNSEDQSATSTLARQYGNCQGFTQVLKYLLNALDIECEVIEGTARGSSYEPGCDVTSLVAPGSATRHCWNRVKISGCWFLCDPTWAAKLELREHGIVTKPSGVREVWFITDPEIFVSTHIPLRYLNDTGQFVADLDEQILYNSLDDLDEWNSRAWVSGSGEKWGIKPLSHRHSVINTTGNCIRISFLCPHVLTLTYTLLQLSTGKELRACVMMYITGEEGCDVVNADVRLPQAGTYMLKIQGNPPFEMCPISFVHNDTDIILTYKIVSTGSEPKPAFSYDDLSWGHTPAFINTGCYVIDYNGAIIETRDGNADVTFRLPTDDLFPHTLTFCDLTDSKSNLDDWFHAERTGRTVKVYLICPQPAEYVFTFWTRTAADSDDFNVSASFLIRSRAAGSRRDRYPPGHGLMWGLQEPAFSLGIKALDYKCSTVKAKRGRCTVSIELSHPIQLSHRLENTNRENWRQFVYAEQDGDCVHYHLQLAVTGRFRFTVAGCERYSAASHQVVAAFLIENHTRYTGPTFPEHENCVWGSRDSLREHGLTSSSQKRSTVQMTPDGRAEILLKLPEISFPLRTTLTYAEQPALALDRFYVSYRCKDPRQVAILVHLPHTGYYALRLYETIEGTLLGSYFLFAKNPCQGKAAEFEPYQGIYGITMAFYQLGLSAYTLGSAYLKTDVSSKYTIPIKVPYPVEMLFVVRRNETEVQGHLLPQRHRKKVVIRFQGEQKGFYQLRAYMKTNAEKPELIFVFLIENMGNDDKFVPFPDCRTVWGLKEEAENLNISVMVDPLEQSQSVLRNIEGIVSITLLHPSEVCIKASILVTDSLPAKLAKRSVLVEKQQSGSEIRVTVPTTGFFVLMVAAVGNRQMKGKPIGAFVIESLTSVGQKYSFPSFCNFLEGCRLFEPLRNPLEANSECYFKVRVPGAVMVQLWDAANTWKAVLSHSGGDIFTGEINMGAAKEAWLSARFPATAAMAENGASIYQKLLMFEVR